MNGSAQRSKKCFDSSNDCLLQVPRSSVVVAEDSDYIVFTVVLFRRVVDNFKTAARQKGFQVRVNCHEVTGRVTLQGTKFVWELCQHNDTAVHIGPKVLIAYLRVPTPTRPITHMNLSSSMFSLSTRIQLKQK